jgi:hypothetical protein
MEGNMKKINLIVGACVLFMLVAGLVSSGAQLPQKSIAKKIFPHISTVSESFDYGLSLYLFVKGMYFPPKTADNNVRRNIRLVSTGSGADANPYVFYTGETGNWTPTQVDDFVPMEVVAGRKYRVGLVEFVAPGLSKKKLISNEVELLLLMKMVTATPNPVPHGTTEVEVTTTNDLGPQGSKIVKLGNQTAVVTQWGGPTKKFKFRIPAVLAVPGIYELDVEENGVAVSNKVQVRLL